MQSTLRKGTINIAHQTEQTGRSSELRAETRLLENGYLPHEPVTREAHDLLITTPDGRHLKAQVKTAYVRADRGNAMVAYARKANGQPYSREEVDVFLAVDGNDVYMFDNRELSEYWRPAPGRPNEWTLLREEAADLARGSA